MLSFIYWVGVGAATLLVCIYLAALVSFVCHKEADKRRNHEPT
jgi:hypothetical protein